MKCKNNITIIRGDSKAFKFQRKNFEGEAIVKAPTTLFFTVKYSYYDKQYVLQKKLDNMNITEDGYWHFMLEPADTESLEYGKYVYDLQVDQDGFKTTIAKGNFNIETEVTYKINEG